MTGRKHRKAFAILGMFSFLIWVVVTQCNYLVKINPGVIYEFYTFCMYVMLQ